MNRDIGDIRKDLGYKFGTTHMRIDTLELRYNQLASDNRAFEEALNTSFDACKIRSEKYKETLKNTATSIYQELAVLAKYHRATESKFEDRFKEQEERHAKDMQSLEARMVAQEERHAKDMQKMERLLQTAMEMNNHSDKIKRGDYELVSDNESLSSENWDIEKNEFLAEFCQFENKEECISEDSEDSYASTREILNSFKEPKKIDLPIAQSLSEMLYEKNYPTL